ncbi:41294_t:CDS:2 [Gigaspora margarita]|uniref:41294_t:CDS:1 n=1 Tax=Gigaspora margarita TaxID=4874 RepID=A0ABN7UF47_GIGMA|nr:41294_t:CDS:2 [Gigaspora margarita]
MNKLTIFDTHCHLADEKYQDEDIEKIIQEAKKVGATGAAEAGLTQLVLSKYHSAPNILTKPSKKYPGKNVISDDYQKVVPAEVRAKMTVH